MMPMNLSQRPLKSAQHHKFVTLPNIMKRDDDPSEFIVSLSKHSYPILNSRLPLLQKHQKLSKLLVGVKKEKKESKNK